MSGKKFYDDDFLRRLERLHLVSKHVSSRWSAGQRRARRMGDGLEFADHRDYAEGDDLRFVDWAFYARMEKLLLRLFHEHSESEVAVMLDTSASMAPGGDLEKFDHARRLAAALAFVAMGSLERVIVLPYADALGECFRGGRNKSQILAVLEFLNDLKPAGSTDLLSASRQVAAGYPQAGIVLLLSDLLNSSEQLGQSLGFLRDRRRDVAVLQTYMSSEVHPQLAGPTRLQAAEDAGRLNVDVSRELIEQYERAWDELQERLRRTCVARGATFVKAPSSEPMEEIILQSLRQAGVLKD